MHLLLSQVKIGENPDQLNQFSLLELESANRTLVVTRINNQEMNAINPLEGALIYNTDAKCLFYYQGDFWHNLCSGSTDLTITANENGTYTFNSNDGPVTINGAPETVTRLLNNDDGSYTYINEDNEEILLQTGIVEGNHIGTPGSVFFANRSLGAPFEANEDFFWDNENKRLGIGTNSPSNELEVDGILKSARITSSFGTAKFPSYHFTGSFNSGMYAPSSGELGLASQGREVVRVTGGNRVGIMVTNPAATLHVGGDLKVDGSIIVGTGKSSKNNISINRISETSGHITADDHTVILSKKTGKISLPNAPKNEGKLLVIKDIGGVPTQLTIPYIDLEGEKAFKTLEKGVLWLQSDGINWQRIN